MNTSVLMLTPSRGRGGGIERYADGIEWSLSAHGIDYRRLDLAGSGTGAHLSLLSRAARSLDDQRARLIVLHRGLLPLAWALRKGRRDIAGISVVFHGTEVWAWGKSPRERLERRVLASSGVRAVAVSNYTAGTLPGTGRATILRPGLADTWYDKLTKSRGNQIPGESITVVTAFRLSAWRQKGLPVVLQALAALHRSDVRLVVCGSGHAPDDLLDLVGQFRFCTIRCGLTDDELAEQLAAADVFVLATRMSCGRDASGEGFGMVLQEAQLAGAAVIGAARGGSHEAFLEGVTGFAPRDEGVDALVDVFNRLLCPPERLAQMRKTAAAWAEEMFEPHRYAELAVDRLL